MGTFWLSSFSSFAIFVMFSGMIALDGLCKFIIWKQSARIFSLKMEGLGVPYIILQNIKCKDVVDHFEI